MEQTENITKPHSISGRYLITPDNVLKSFNADYLDEIACRTWILKGLHGDNAHCPGCGALILDMKRLRHFWRGERLRCRACGKFFTAMTGTFFAGCHMTFPEMFLMMFLLGAGFKDKLIAETLNVSQESIRLWRNKFKYLSKGEPF